MKVRMRRVLRSASCLAACALGGCGFLTLKKDIEASKHQLEPAAVQGDVAIRGASSGPIVVVVYSVAAGRTNGLVLPRPGPFFFALPAGTYRIAAYEDRNHDLAYQPGTEPAAVLGDPGELVLRPGERRANVDLTIDPGAAARIPFAVAAVSAEQDENGFLPDLQLGTIVSIDDPRFSDENGKLGLWQPLEFASSIGAGVYFLEEYDPNKIPILFVHGAGGHPGNWKYLVSTLDRSRFQPWLAYYPSAPHLDRVGRGLVRAIGALQLKYGFSRMIVVAHSMGGLVARAAINSAMTGAETQRVVSLPAFVTISSPWNGHSAAAQGVKRSPVVAPSWIDMAPGSAFLSHLPATPLPPECEYSLFFSYRSSGLSREANDETVAVSSELSLPIQLQAAHVLGFDETHTSILDSPEVAAQVNAILLRAATAPRTVTAGQPPRT